MWEKWKKALDRQYMKDNPVTYAALQDEVNKAHAARLDMLQYGHKQYGNGIKVDKTNPTAPTTATEVAMREQMKNLANMAQVGKMGDMRKLWEGWLKEDQPKKREGHKFPTPPKDDMEVAMDDAVAILKRCCG